MVSDSRGITRLKKFAGEIPDERQTLALLRELERGDHGHSSDRTAAIVAGTFVENALRVAILARLRPDNEDHKLIFEGENGPLATFSARIHVAHALRIFGPKTLSDLQRIKAVRNAFAHSMMTMTFTSPQIVTVCQSLTSYRRLTLAGGGAADNAKEKYIRSTSYISGGLKQIAIMTPQDILKNRHHVWPATTDLW